MTGPPEEPIVTTAMFTEAEKAAWEVAVNRGLSIEAADLRVLVEAAAHARPSVPDCWLCNGLSGIAIHNKWSAQRGKPLWTAHEFPSDDDHPVLPCPACTGAEASAKLTRIREAAAEWALRCPPGDWGEGGSEAVIADAGRGLLRPLGEEGAQ